MRILIPGVLALAVTAAPAFGQPAPAVEFTAGWTGFADESIIHHGAAGTAGRFPIGKRISVGPELIYMQGPGSDRDVFLSGLLVADLRTGSGDRRPGIVPYAVISGGLMFHHPSGGRDEWLRAWSLTGGLGVRRRLSDRWQIGVESRIGVEPQLRLTGAIIYDLR